MKTSALLLSLVLSFSVFANEVKDRKAITTLVEATKKIAQNDLSCKDKNDCLIFATGKRACGGPNGIVVTSKNNLLIEEVEYLAKQTEIQEADFNQRYGIFSICSIVMRPVVVCEKNLCKY